jgi:hypothetical protein
MQSRKLLLFTTGLKHGKMKTEYKVFLGIVIAFVLQLMYRAGGIKSMLIVGITLILLELYQIELNTRKK